MPRTRSTVNPEIVDLLVDGGFFEFEDDDDLEIVLEGPEAPPEYSRSRATLVASEEIQTFVTESMLDLVHVEYTEYDAHDDWRQRESSGLFIVVNEVTADPAELMRQGRITTAMFSSPTCCAGGRVYVWKKRSLVMRLI